MIDEKYERLMWQVIDGANTPEEQRLLDAYCAAHPDARQHFDELRSFASVLGGVGEIEPPPALKSRILSALPADGLRREDKGSFLAALRAVLPSRRNTRYAYFAAAGFLLGIIGYHLLNYRVQGNWSLDIAKFYGTMRTDTSATSTHRLDIAGEGFTGTLHYRLEHDLMLADLDLVSETDVQCDVAYEGDSFRLAGLRDIPAGTTNRISVNDGRITLNNLGKGKYSFVLRLRDRSRSPVTVTVFSGDSVLFEGSITP
jgi:hypothetical protein